MSVEDNSRHFVDYQDCESVGKDQLVCSRIAERPNLAADNSKFGIGGLALINLKNNKTIHDVPVTELSPQGHVITRNPVFVEKAGEEIKLYIE